jgi:hypothetical protein
MANIAEISQRLVKKDGEVKTAKAELEFLNVNSRNNVN